MAECSQNPTLSVPSWRGDVFMNGKTLFSFHIEMNARTEASSSLQRPWVRVPAWGPLLVFKLFYQNGKKKYTLKKTRIKDPCYTGNPVAVNFFS